MKQTQCNSNICTLHRSSQHPAANVGKTAPKSTPSKSVLGGLKPIPKAVATPSPASTSKSTAPPPAKPSPATPKPQPVPPKRLSVDSNTPSTSAPKIVPKK